MVAAVERVFPWLEMQWKVSMRYEVGEVQRAISSVLATTKSCTDCGKEHSAGRPDQSEELLKPLRVSAAWYKTYMSEHVPTTQQVLLL